MTNESKIINGDSLDELKNLAENSIDGVVTDPPYGYSFMGKNWDRAVPSVEIWKECLRALKPGAFCMVMSAPRSDVQNAMISRLMEAGFRLDFTPIYWTYASGFPKAGNIAKLVDKRLGHKGEVIGIAKGASAGMDKEKLLSIRPGLKPEYEVREHSDQAKALDGSYAGFQPKPAVEVVIVAMKPISEKTYVDQALKNGKGITWLDDCRVPVQDSDVPGRFPANLLVSDDVLNDGRVIKSTGPMKHDYREQNNDNTTRLTKNIQSGFHHNDSGSYSRYFDLDAWADTLPFLAVPKASKREKNKGLDGFPEVVRSDQAEHLASGDMPQNRSNNAKKNHHPTVKPLKLMSYLITLISREGDTILDPFVGSGTTVLAAKQLGRTGIGIEREAEYADIARARINDDDITDKVSTSCEDKPASCEPHCEGKTFH